MTQEKKERVFLASVALAVLILVLCFVITIFQTVSIVQRKKELSALNQEIARYEQMIEDEADEITKREQQELIEDLARRLGYKYPDEVEKN